MTEKGTRINIVFKQVPVNVFNFEQAEVDGEELPQNILTIYIQPTEGFSLTLNGKKIGQGFNTEPVKLISVRVPRSLKIVLKPMKNYY